ncbi:hypothetical protein AB6A40_007211 [Gnathostoma spinigerum]|uniref:Uncharacterized protein n=1 Tax=Gnathostoma spinigerum TaxID=75299 RepID=A0ABD6EMR6_9BILA
MEVADSFGQSHSSFMVGGVHRLSPLPSGTSIQVKTCPSQMEKTITEWFNNMITFRIAKAAGWYCLLTFFWNVVFAILLQMSIFHPLKTLSDISSLISSLHLYVLSSLNCLIGFCYCYLVGKYLLRFDVEKKLSVLHWRPWMIFGAIFLLDYLKFFLLFRSSRIFLLADPVNDSASVLLHSLILMISLSNVFHYSYQLVFPANELGAIHKMQNSLRVSLESTIHESIRFTVPWISMSIAMLILLLFGIPGLKCFFSLYLLFTSSVTMFSQFYLHRVAVGFSKAFILQAYNFRMPPPYTVLEPTGEQLRTLMNALDSTNVPLKAFAFWDLRRIAVSPSPARRLAIFSLSQPGGHPRNWNAIRCACLDAIEHVRLRVSEENQRILRKNYVSKRNGHIGGTRSKELMDRAFVLPPAFVQKDQMLRKRVLSNVTAKDTTPSILESESTLITSAMSWISRNQAVITSYEANIAMMAIECKSDSINLDSI